MHKTLLLTDIVDSTALTEKLGNKQMSKIWIAHDRIARALLPIYQGREADRTDGFLLLFDQPEQACAYANELHQAFADLSRDHDIDFKARIGIHTGEIILIEHTEIQKAAGAKPIEVEGIAKPAAARIVSVARGGQTLLSRDAKVALEQSDLKVVSHGHWRMKGIAEPVELFEAGTETTKFIPPEDGDKVYRVNLMNDIWTPIRDSLHNLTLERDQFIGRKADLHDLAELVHEPAARLITILGPGGTGKTRLSQRFGRIWLGDFPGGVWFCDLSEARSIAGITAAVASALDVPLTAGDSVDQLGQAIQGRGECLVILDNFEQVAGNAGETLRRWMINAPLAKFVVTSRVLLQLPGEKTLELRPLPTEKDAVQLFEARAKDRKREFEITSGNRSDVIAIVKELDGMPLAIELAAARIAVLQPKQIRERLSDRFKLLRGKKGLTGRQQTLRGAIDWSWDILEDYERSVLAQSSLFEGGFSLEAAEAVISLAHFPDAPFTMDVIQDLVDKSLLKSDVQKYDPSIPEIGMYISIREYAAQKLRTEGVFPGSGLKAQRECRERYIQYYSGFGSHDAVRELTNCDDPTKIAALKAETDNLFSALTHALEYENSTAASLLVMAIWQMLKRVGPRHIIRESTERIVKMDKISTESRIRVNMVLHELAVTLADKERAEETGELTLSLAREEGDKYSEACVLVSMAYLLTNYSGGRRSLDYAEKSLAIAREYGYSHVEAMALQLKANALKEQHKTELMENVLQEGLAVSRKHGDLEREAGILDSLGSVAKDTNRQAEAQQYYRDSLKIARKIGNRFFEIIISFNMAQSYFMEGEYQLSEECYRSASDCARQVGDVRFPGCALIGISLIHIQKKEFEEARELLQRALKLFTELDDKYFLAFSYHSLGLIDFHEDRNERALANHTLALNLAIEMANKGAEAQMRADLGLVLSRLGRTAEALSEYSKSEQILLDNCNEQWLTRLYARWAHGAVLESDLDTAKRKEHAASQLAAKLELKPSSEARREIKKVQEFIAEAMLSS